MKILIYSDNHWCSYSSIVRSMGNKYSTRLENQIQTLNWIEQTAVENDCDAIFCLGDFFDQSVLSDQELTALKDIKWSNLSHLFLVGNHESSRSDLRFSSTQLLSLCPNVTIIDDHRYCMADDFNQLCFLPYVNDSSSVKINDIFKDKSQGKRYIFSHNDIAGIQMGKFISTSGISIDDIENNCDLFINGHLHNGQFISDKILNVGNVTGQNFSEDAEKYKHGVYILDIASKSLTFIENPYALKFYKFDFTSHQDFDLINSVGSNSVISVSVNEDDFDYIKDVINNNYNIIESRVLINRSTGMCQKAQDDIEFNFSVDHIKQFYEFITNTLGTSEIVKNELQEIMK